MPTYEYACRACGQHLEVVQSFADDALTECEACGGELRKVFSAAGLIFKGSGWHVKDYASGSRSAPSGGGGGDGGGAADTKPKDAGSSSPSPTPSTTPPSSTSSSSSD